MPDRHLTPELLRGYAAGTLAPPDLIGADDHLFACDDCCTRLDQIKPRVEALAALQASLTGGQRAVTGMVGGHLAYPEIALWLDDAMRGEERDHVTAHLDSCARCREDVEALRLSRTERSQRAAGVRGTVPDVSFRTLPAQRAQTHWRTGAGLAAGLVLLTLLFSARQAWEMRQGRADLSAAQARLRDLSGRDGALRQQYEAARRQEAALRQQTREAADDSAGTQQALRQRLALLQDRLTVLQAQRKAEERRRATELASVAVRQRQTAGPSLWDRGIEAAVRATPAQVALLAPGPGLRGSTSDGLPAATPLAPIATLVLGDRPVFRWKAVPGATTYHIFVTGTDNVSVLPEATRSGTEWAAPRTLARGRVYLWQVEAFQGDRQVARSPVTRFGVASPKTVAALARARVGSLHRRMAQLYLQAHLLDDAERELHAVVPEDPDYPAAQALLRRVQDERHQ